ncbi:type I-F CRISPR-associated helicase Cas3 [Vibrio parahaemolyticus]|nr:type I-F CRISPR-associated helicase Cas3 [Vibrio parahaemolyticus]EHK7589886.1 type I-F CRISPR-associated helicase Cas3 [Vibrio parahaemolyticus]EHR1007207.1 type I-F CRISPR-associated helicase Cas3 [Vibrio parahaemolyticus]EKK9989491.1 type I-F CRISPR-associated helicase Cas3 [Vibrio parahaemolyticus]EME0831430.1 type I-F CRISPR-associated helicase Cas3 [Vibrio parahaemolyticus]
MMVTFVSQCEKNALKKTRRVLDAFANRIGDNTWQTLITEDGLQTVQKMLRQTASRSTAVSCHWVRSRSRSQFLWVVGNKKKFNLEGYVAVNSTEKDLLNSEYESDWKYLPVIKALTSMAALLHDWGKASLLFQEKLHPDIQTKHKGDPLRHEWISCLLFNQFVTSVTPDGEDKQWLSAIINDGIHSPAINSTSLMAKDKPLAELPTVASLISWLIVSHHRLPLPKEPKLCDNQRDKSNTSLADLLKRITQAWGYENQFDDYQKLLPKCFSFPLGLLSDSSIWNQQIQKRAKDLFHHLPLIEQAVSDGSWRVILHHARLCLMLGDHHYSSQPNDPLWNSSTELYANTDQNTKALKQKLDEHLVNVAKAANDMVKLLPHFESEPLSATELSALAAKPNTPKQFRWQDKAVRNILQWRDITEDKSNGYFVVNMASTGCGKTMANAKIMQALSEDKQSLRFILALGLRTLTLQTGDEYKQRLKLTEDDLAVLIGSKAIFELHQSGQQFDKEEKEYQQAESGSESLESLLDENDELCWSGALPEDGLSTVLTNSKERQLLYAPVLACTIDHIMAATETKRGGRYILPCLRLMSSDLVIDEIDDFTGDDLIAIGRLVHLAALLGRRVMISSATIPPDLALGLYNAYRQGWALFAASRDQVSSVNCVYVDEFNTQAELISSADSDWQQYQAFQQQFITKRVAKLKQQDAKRKADIFACDKHDRLPTEPQYYQHIQQAIIEKHQHHSTCDLVSQTHVSFGVVRVANIQPCVRLTQYLLACDDWPEGTEIRCMAYHSQQVLLLRHEQEKYLDIVLKRKEKDDEVPVAFNEPLIRQHIDNCRTKNLIFILVATPVEEVGRDHDFDWAVIEPSSFRSIIQMAGRVRRHRDGEVAEPNISLLQYNYKGFKGGVARVFNHPGYETERSTQLDTHDLKLLVDEKLLLQSVNAIERIQKRPNLTPRTNLADLEHFATAKTLGVEHINKPSVSSTSRQDRFARHRRPNPSDGFWNDHLHGHITGHWWMTALPQYFKRFRKSEPSVQLYLVKKHRTTEFCIRDEQGGLNTIEQTLNIERQSLTNEQQQRLWLYRDYDALVSQYSSSADDEFKTSVKFGEISFTDRGEQDQYSYNDQLGLVKVK